MGLGTEAKGTWGLLESRVGALASCGSESLLESPKVEGEVKESRGMEVEVEKEC